MSDLADWSQVAAENNDASPDGAPEGWRWREVNDTLRETMAAVRRFYGNAEFRELVSEPVVRNDATTVRILGADYTGLFVGGERVRLTAGSLSVDAQVDGSTLTGGDTVVELVGSEVPIGCDGILLHVAPSIGSAAFATTGLSAGTVPLSENVKDLTAGEVPYATVGADLVLTTNFQLVCRFPLTLGNGAIPMWLSLDLALQAIFPDLPTYVIGVFLGPTSTVFDTAIWSGRWGNHTYSGLSILSDLSATRKLVIPHIDLGFPDSTDWVTVWARIEAMGTNQAYVLGTYGSPLSPSRAMVRRHF